MSDNDNDFSIGEEATPSCDGHGPAALLLVESLIHGLCENATLSTAQAIEIANRAVSVQADRTEAANGSATTDRQSHALLSSIAASLMVDGDDDGDDAFPPPRLVP